MQGMRALSHLSKVTQLKVRSWDSNQAGDSQSSSHHFSFLPPEARGQLETRGQPSGPPATVPRGLLMNDCTSSELAIIVYLFLLQVQGVYQPWALKPRRRIIRTRHCDFESVQGINIAPVFQEYETKAVWGRKAQVVCTERVSRRYGPFK